MLCSKFVFNSLSKNVVYSILDKIIIDLEKRLSDKRIKIELTKKAKDFIIDNSYDENLGARPIKRYVGRNVESLIANNIINDNIKFNSTITIDVKDSILTLKDN